MELNSMAKKYTDETIQKVKRLYLDGESLSAIGQSLDLNKNQIDGILKRCITDDDRANRKDAIYSAYIGKKFGRLVIKRYISKKGSREILFECECDCGNIIERPKGDIIKRHTKSCGCLAKEKMTCYGDISGRYWNRVQRLASERGISFNLDIRDVWSKFLTQNRCCAISGIPLVFARNHSRDYKTQTASLDRIDNAKPYIIENVQWVHKKINSFRSGLSLEQVFSLCKKVANYKRVKDLDLFNNRWDIKYLSLAEFIAQWSKDKSTKVGAVIFDEDSRVVSLGYNGFPQFIKDREEWLDDREMKLQVILHAEMNAMLFAQRSLKGCSIATWPMMPCSCCAAAVAQAGIKRVVSLENDNPRWQRSFEISKQIFEERGVTLKLYKDTFSDMAWL